MDSCRRLINSNPINGSVRFMRNTGTLVWNCICCNNQEHSIEVIIEEIKEIRLLEKIQIQVFYGGNFILDFVHFECYSLPDRNSLVEKLNIEIEANKHSSYKSKLERYLMRKINSIKKIYDANGETGITIQEARSLFQEIELTVTEKELQKLFYRAKNSQLLMKVLVKFVTEEILAKQESILEYRLDDCPSLNGEYISRSKQMTFDSFKKFLIEKQGLLSTHANKETHTLLSDLLMEVSEDFLSPNEFLNYMFCEQNEIMDDIFIQEMSKPLSHYYIASSHNTYLTGDQLKSESSEEAYARVLRQGCRCIELDCWSSQGKIVITHGGTATTKISFESVLKTIKIHAFAVTEYPLILSIENHCLVDHQREMARLFTLIFGDMLLTEPIREDETVLPSPNSLKNKIILKFKKITNEDQQTLSSNDDDEDESEYTEGIRRGYLYIKPSENEKWGEKMFSLSEMYLKSSDEKDQDEDKECKETFCHELWFHGSVSANHFAEQQYSADTCAHIKMGSFFVANVVQGENANLMLFVWNDYGVPLQLPIHVDNNNKYAINPEDEFESLEELIGYYQHNYLHVILNDEYAENEPIQEEIRLITPIYRMNDHTKMEWFHPNITKAQSEKLFEVYNKCGSFLVRNCESSPGDLTLVFCSDSSVTKKVVYRLKVKRYDKSFMFEKSRQQFKSVVNMIEHFQHNEIYHSKTALRFPITRKLANEALENIQRATEMIYCLEESKVSEPYQTSFPHNFELVDIWAFKLTQATEEIILGCKDLERAKLWVNAIGEVISVKQKNKEDCQRKFQKIAKEMSDITIYFQKGEFKKSFFSEKGKGAYNECFSLNEDMMTKIMLNNTEKIVQFHQISITRIYPKGFRITSSNYDPLPFWFYGSQMVALNYQTGDIPMQLNYAWFQQNKNTGYVLRPHCSEDISTEPLYLEVTVLGARILCGNKWKLNLGYVELEIHGVSKDCQIYKSTLEGDSLCMVNKNRQPEKHEFFIKIPEFALLQFTVYGKSKTSYALQYTIHVNNLREQGYRNVPLMNMNSEPILLSSLLVYVRKWKEIELTEKMEELSNEANSSGLGTSHQLWKKEYENLERIRNKFWELDNEN